MSPKMTESKYALSQIRIMLRNYLLQVHQRMKLDASGRRATGGLKVMQWNISGLGSSDKIQNFLPVKVGQKNQRQERLDPRKCPHP